MANATPLYKPERHFELNTRVYRPGVGFNAPDQYGVVVAHDFFGSAVVAWES
jgi:hypothetical protein